MKVSLSLVPWLTVLVVVAITRAAVISRDDRGTTGLDSASAGEGLEEEQVRQESGHHSPTHHRRHHHHPHHEHLHHHRGGGHHSGGCPGCRQWQELSRTSEEELIQLRIERIKQDLLNRLGLSAPPNVTTSSSSSSNRIPENIPAPLQQLNYNDDDDLDSSSGRRPPSLNDEDGGQDELIEGHSKQIIVFAEEAAFLHKHRPPTMHLPPNIHFTLPSELPSDYILSVELWLYKKNNNIKDEPNCSTNTTQTMSIHSLLTSNVSQHSLTNWTSPQLLASQEVPPHAGWFRMDFLSAVQSWLADPRTEPHGVSVEHSQCVSLGTDQSHRPFLTIGTRGTRVRRRKRNAQQCHDGSQNCCRKHHLHIDFKELGWNFILSPAGYTANYCHGPCSVPSFENLMNSERRHSSILQKVSRLRNNPDVLPCCSPTSLSSLSLIYNDGKGMTIHQDLDNMRVDSCGCS